MNTNKLRIFKMEILKEFFKNKNILLIREDDENRLKNILNINTKQGFINLRYEGYTDFYPIIYKNILNKDDYNDIIDNNTKDGIFNEDNGTVYCTNCDSNECECADEMSSDIESELFEKTLKIIFN